MGGNPHTARRGVYGGSPGFPTPPTRLPQRRTNKRMLVSCTAEHAHCTHACMHACMRAPELHVCMCQAPPRPPKSHTLCRHAGPRVYRARRVIGCSSKQWRTPAYPAWSAWACRPPQMAKAGHTPGMRLAAHPVRTTRYWLWRPAAHSQTVHPRLCACNRSCTHTGAHCVHTPPTSPPWLVHRHARFSHARRQAPTRALPCPITPCRAPLLARSRPFLYVPCSHTPSLRARVHAASGMSPRPIACAQEDHGGPSAAHEPAGDAAALREEMGKLRSKAAMLEEVRPLHQPCTRMCCTHGRMHALLRTHTHTHTRIHSRTHMSIRVVAGGMDNLRVQPLHFGSTRGDGIFGV